MAEERTRRLAGNTAIIAIGQFGSKVLVYLLTRVYTELLTTKEYSLATNVSEIATVLIPLISLGIGEAIFRLAKGDEFKKKEVFTDAFVIWLVGCLFIPFIVPVILNVGFLKNYFADYIPLILFYVMASVFHTICTNYIRAKGKVRLYAIQGILNTALVICLNIIFLIPLKMSSFGYVLSVPCADLIVTLFIIVKEKLWRDFDIKSVRKSSLKTMLRYSVPLIPTTVFMWIINISDRLMVTFMVGDAENGVYSAGYKIPTLLGIINSIFIYAWQISAMEEANGKDKKEFFSSVFSSYSSLMFLLCGGMTLFSRVISYLMFSKSYNDQGVWIYIPILCVAMALHNFSSFLDSDNMVRMKSVPTMLTAFAGAVVNVALNFYLIRYVRLNAMGAAIATYVSYLVTFTLRAIIVRKTIRVNVIDCILNNLLLIAMSIVTVNEPSHWILIDILLFAVIVIVNFRELFEIFKKLYLMLSRRSSS
ncbi:MAG: oligosaccharide flippase family protein [Clostridia bacterium]|nr:oligosaccharide flippase family protein [Clostridia bacterium]